MNPNETAHGTAPAPETDVAAQIAAGNLDAADPAAANQVLGARAKDGGQDALTKGPADRGPRHYDHDANLWFHSYVAFVAAQASAGKSIVDGAVHAQAARAADMALAAFDEKYPK